MSEVCSCLAESSREMNRVEDRANTIMGEEEGFIPLQNISEYVSIYWYYTQHHGGGGGLHTPTEHIRICEYILVLYTASWGRRRASYPYRTYQNM